MYAFVQVCPCGPWAPAYKKIGLARKAPGDFPLSSPAHTCIHLFSTPTVLMRLTLDQNAFRIPDYARATRSPLHLSVHPTSSSCVGATHSLVAAFPSSTPLLGRSFPPSCTLSPYSPRRARYPRLRCSTRSPRASPGPPPPHRNPIQDFKRSRASRSSQTKRRLQMPSPSSSTTLKKLSRVDTWLQEIGLTLVASSIILSTVLQRMEWHCAISTRSARESQDLSSISSSNSSSTFSV
ncbi:hypothetical protein BOTBODRAFT_407436 [Botryobasidium botryosum FD-172 SS1]|uniref:Uncharacterized protein n=1 Tax=Botryobasidium botryosum (strain FD-172 SS1) TaxID=930990 RepID=A0A067MLB2_BOTB1|nr:hypothetical protein BOTBODRAFT_407436 [Botryobasidium botryosum FD-172 SS1]